jgi:NAD(P)-dependent dehydrogenase (short-subunit alcohol dehydrogenase family)
VIDAMSSVLITGSNDGSAAMPPVASSTASCTSRAACTSRAYAGLEDLDWIERPWDGRQAYADSKLFDATLAAALARRRPDTVATSVTPGWVATKMGGAGAPDDLEAGSITQTWLAVSDDPEALHGGALPYHQAPRPAHPAVADEAFQDRLLDAFARLTGVPMP